MYLIDDNIFDRSESKTGKFIFVVILKCTAVYRQKAKFIVRKIGAKRAIYLALIITKINYHY